MGVCLGAQTPHSHQQVQLQKRARTTTTDRIIDDIGGAFAMGCVGGGAWHLVKGLKTSPSGFRMRGALEVGVAVGCVGCGLWACVRAWVILPCVAGGLLVRHAHGAHLVRAEDRRQ